MKLYLKNHTERYPVEQLQLQLFAQEPSEFCTSVKIPINSRQTAVRIPAVI